MAPQRPSHQRILSLDGGGFLGLSSLIILETIMDEASRRAGQVVRPSEVFDLISYRSLLFSIFGESEESFWDRLLSSSPFNEEAYQEALRDLVGRHASGGLPRMRADTSIHSKTLIALTVDSPEENGRVVHVRSYSPPPGASISTFPGHEWSIQEVARATVAQPAFMRPLVLRNENSTFSYRDAGLCGFNNPTQLALREASRIWSRDQIGLLNSSSVDSMDHWHPSDLLKSIKIQHRPKQIV
ncbi:FabD/lysophospholipase-like protein [Neolentinus lepideus HHB14362 ss-1]|uniref:FabD/lysophospholipase-like protein n=1 Tax=Neolentinus lepideus HHB14362 ss-1 TaxID=1314782 RepID=A0A165QFX3_9AGAM|nr:FabD/lysophospholipase-like protein [Neolentinus lepideus HHB14362 ss-1]